MEARPNYIWRETSIISSGYTFIISDHLSTCKKLSMPSYCPRLSYLMTHIDRQLNTEFPEGCQMSKDGGGAITLIL